MSSSPDNSAFIQNIFFPAFPILQKHWVLFTIRKTTINWLLFSSFFRQIILLFHGLNKRMNVSLTGFDWKARRLTDLVSTLILYSPIMAFGDELISIETLNPSTLITRALHSSSNTMEKLEECLSSKTGAVICVFLEWAVFSASDRLWQNLA